ncbi:MAG: hypothetical protein DHS20C21_19150 [Gemmatimonadota bacterium]|nr:MAG: hypothetical protein DHS20C21_19150 [Gemmatimonadota bacterium]
METENGKTIVWASDTLATLRSYSVRVRQTFGHALRDAQFGQRHAKAKALRGFGGSGVLEVVQWDSRGTYRLAWAQEHHEQWRRIEERR